MPAAPSPTSSGGGRPRGPVSWFVRRAGLARCTTIAAVAGMALAALAPGCYPFAVGGLTVALVGMLAAHVLGRAMPASRAALPLMLASVVTIGLTAGLLLGTLRISALLSGVIPARIGESVQAELVITGPVAVHSGWESALARVEDISPDKEGRARGVGETVLVEVAPARTNSDEADPAGEPTGSTIFQGERLVAHGTLVAPDGASDSGYDQAKVLLHEGVRVVLEVRSSQDCAYVGRRDGVSGWFDRLRESARAHLSRGPDGRVSEVLKGVVIGDTGGIDKGWMEAFRRSGTAHMLSVSGLHVASLAAIILGLARVARLSRRAGSLLAAVAALLLVPFVGASPPVIRAAAMMVVVLGGRLVGRRRDPWQGLAFAALFVLAINPFAVFDVGFQLSFSAFAGMLTLVRPLERVFRRFPESIRANLAVSLSATLGTAPVSLLVFGRTSLVAPVANLLVVPTLGVVTGAGMASVLFGFLWSGLSVALDFVASLPMMWTVQVSRLCARAPVLAPGSAGIVMSSIAAAILALPAGIALSGRPVATPWGLPLPGFGRATGWLRRRRPAGRRQAVAAALLVVAMAAGVGAAAYPAAAASLRSIDYVAGGRDWPARTEVRVLDVGQGNAVLVRTPDHHTALFDGGPAGCGLEHQLRSLGVKHLDVVVISHPHADHFAGLAEVLGSLEVGTLIDWVEVGRPEGTESGGAVRNAGSAAGYAAGGAEARDYLEFRARLAEGGCRIIPASAGGFSLDGVAVRLYTPTRPLVMREGGEPWGEGRSPPTGDELNAGSIVALLDLDGVRVLLPGDAEAGTLANYDLPAVDVLVVGHHGSRGAVTGPLLDALSPHLAVISVGSRNGFGHPDSETISTLALGGIGALRTDKSGWVSLRKTDGGLAVSMERTEAA